MLGEQITDEQIREAHFVMIRDKNGEEYRLYVKNSPFVAQFVLKPQL